MKSVYYMVSERPMEDPEPLQPTPFPIRIIQDPPPESDAPAPSDTTPEKRNDFFYETWDRFLAIAPKRAKRSPSARKLQEVKDEANRTPGDGLQVHENAATSWEQAAAECKAKVAAIVEECKRLNQKYRDALFDLETNSYCLMGLNGRYPKAIEKQDPPPWIRRVEDIFDDPQFFIDGATATDVHQGHAGDCWFLAALMAISAKPELIIDLCVARDEQYGVYGFVFYRDGEWVPEVIDDKLFLKVGDDDDLQIVRDWHRERKEGMSLRHDEDKLKDSLQRGGEALYFSHCKSSETWLPLIEKAYAKAHGDYFSIEGGFASEGIEDLTGGVGVVINPEDIADKDRFWKEQLSQVNEKYLFGGGSKSSNSKGISGGHAYAVLQAWESEDGTLKLLKLRNPWGEVEWEGDWSDGSKLWTAEMMTKLDHTFGDDGVFWMCYKDFLKHFPSINRVRLFNKQWSVAQQWTCVSVPWTVDYLDTKFQFSISEKGPVVIVLSQPDDRYFYGLRGRFLYSMHFRVYKEGDEEKWIVRSMHNSGNETIFTRSVSAEIEGLEPGTYNVVFKVTAVRSNSVPTAEEAILKYAIERKEKLLHVGRRYDYAQSKGNLRAIEDSHKQRQRVDKKDNRTRLLKKERFLNKLARERLRLRKKRVEEAMKVKRKEHRIAMSERRQKVLQRRQTPSTEAQATEGATDDSDAKVLDSASATDLGTAHAGGEIDGAAHENEKKSSEEDGDGDGAEHLATHFSSLDLGKESPTNAADPVSPIEDDVDNDEDYETPQESPEELEDDDFDWDSDIDGPVHEEDLDDEDDNSLSASSSKNAIFADDPWNAYCVLGLRVYSLNSKASVTVVKGENDS
ncbi:Calpain-type cysteine protease DEK1 [Teratosphaeria destructans]|uniref:Calpain-type cysteine protease DEK1 n=1 Tax=Teratosphaeria destructans TaxID=418781 RepID=A0A9W7SHD5_9PEZI|nr:Calpain-type cysteine protease DEK1 [Teratosphaeria destructans]